MHTVIAADSDGRPIRVACGYCGSDHNYRGGPRVDSSPPADTGPADYTTSRAVSRAKPARDTFPIVSDRERIAPPMSVARAADVDLEMLLRRVIGEEAGTSAVQPAGKWRGEAPGLGLGTPRR